MYVDPFLAGVIFTILGEVLTIILAAIYQYFKRRKKREI